MPALEDLLNREVWNHRRNHHANEMIWRYRERASILWYEITWQGASDEDKLVTAMYGLRPDSPVHVDPAVSSDRLKEVLPLMRDEVYGFLLSDNVTYVFHSWNVNACSCLARLLSEEELTPTQDDVTAIADGTNSFAKIVLIAYLLNQQDERAIEMITDWIHEYSTDFDIDYLIHVISYLDRTSQFSEDLRREVATAATQAAYILYDELQTRKFNRNDLWLIGSLNLTLYRLGNFPASRNFLSDYLELRSQMGNPTQN